MTMIQSYISTKQLLACIPNWYTVPAEAASMSIDDWLAELTQEMYISQGGTIESRVESTTLDRTLNERQARTPKQLEELFGSIEQLEKLRDRKKPVRWNVTLRGVLSQSMFSLALFPFRKTYA